MDSVINQHVDNMEILIIDDGSTDSTPELCKQLEKQHLCIRVIRQDNQGVSAARNTGIANAKGQYILFLDSDDFIVPNILSSELIEEMGRGGIDIMMFSSLCANMHKNRFYIEQQYPNRTFLGRQIFPLSGHFGSCIYKSELLKNNDIWFDEGVSLNEDQVFKIKSLYMAGRIQTSPNFLYVYCDNPHSIMHTMDKKMDRVVAWERAYTWFGKHLTGQERTMLQTYAQHKINARTLLYAKNYVQADHSQKELEEELTNYNYLIRLENLTPGQVMPYQIEELRLFQTDRKTFVRKAKMEGWKISLGRLALKIPFVRMMRDRKRYLLTEIPHRI